VEATIELQVVATAIATTVRRLQQLLIVIVR